MIKTIERVGKGIKEIFISENPEGMDSDVELIRESLAQVRTPGDLIRLRTTAAELETKYNTDPNFTLETLRAQIEAVGLEKGWTRAPLSEIQRELTG